MGARTTQAGLAGAPTSPPHPLVPRPVERVMADTTGRRKAQVLPLPVCAQHMRSSPADARGTEWRWMGVGRE